MQLAALTALRATMHCFIRSKYRDGPFFFTLTDLHRSNIFVDEHWNIQAIIDLEWACSQSIEMQLPPYWLTSKAVDGYDNSESVAELDTLLKEYFAIYEEEEKARNGNLYQAPVMRHVWETSNFWYFQAVTVPKGMYRIFNRNIQPLFNKEHCKTSIFDQVFSRYWGVGAQEVIRKKLKDKEEYKCDSARLSVLPGKVRQIKSKQTKETELRLRMMHGRVRAWGDHRGPSLVVVGIRGAKLMEHS